MALDKLILLFLFVSTRASPWSSDQPDGCPVDHSVHLLLPHESDCAKYYQCNFGQKILRDCGPGTHFDEKLQICNWPDAVKCRNKPTPAPEWPTAGTTVPDAGPHLPNGCPADFHVHLLLPHETDCSKFYYCSHGQRLLRSCGPKRLFDKYLQVCNWPHAVKCQYQPTTKEPEEPATTKPTTTEPDTTKPTEQPPSTKPTTGEPATTNPTTEEPPTTKPSIVEPTTTAKPDETTIETTKTTNAEPDTEYTTVKPTTTEISETTTDSTTTSPGRCPDNFFGNIAHPERCDLFILCLGGDAIELPCMPGLEFDSAVGDCIDIAPGGCTLGGVTTTSVVPTTEDQTTVRLTTEYAETDMPEVSSTTPKPTTTDQITAEPTTVESTTKVETTTDSTTTSPGRCPDNFFGNIAHPERCDLFILCLGGDAIELPCMPGLEFDSAVGDCIEIAPGGCTLGDVTTTSVDPTTEDQSTVGLTTEYAETDTPEVSSTTSKPTTTDQITAEPATVESTSTTTKVETTTDSTTTSPGRCPDNFFGNIAHPERCDLFILCLGGDAIELPCMPGLEFDSAVGDCIEIAPGGCTLGDVTTTSVDPTTEDQSTVGLTTEYAETDTPEVSSTTSKPTTTDQITAEPATVESTSTTTKVETTTDSTTTPPGRCPDNFFGNIAHPERCDLFILCLGGDAIELPCMPGLEFDSAVGDCIDIAPGGCTLGDVTTTSVDPTTEDQTTVGLTTEYAETDTPEVSSTTSKPTTTDQITTESTTVESTTTTTKVETTTHPTTTSPGRCPDNFFGNIAHPERCDLFILCLGGDAIELPCMPGLEFDSAVGDCIDIAPGGCTLGGVTTTSVVPTTEDQTTVGLTTEYAETDTPEVSSTTSKPTTTDQITTEPTTVESTTKVETTTDSTTTSPGRCPDNFFGNIAHPERCDLFILCLGGDAIELPCMPGLEFDSAVGDCIDIAPGGCTLGDVTTTSVDPTTEDQSTVGLTTEYAETDTPEVSSTTSKPTTTDQITAEPTTVESTSTTTKVETTTDSTTTSPGRCPDNFFGNIAHPERCDLFILCLGGDAIELPCMPGLEFDSAVGDCIDIAPGGCTLGDVTTTSVDPTTEDQSTVGLTTEYAETHIPEVSSTTSKPTTTDQITAEPTTVESTTTTTKVETTTDSTTTSPGRCPDNFFGNIAHPERCDLFILCLGGDAIELPCMPGLEFDSAVGDCIDIAPGGCTLGDVTTTSVDPTTEDQSTVGLTTEYAETDTPEVSSTTSKPTTTDQITAEPTTVESTTTTTKVETTTDSTTTSPGRCPDNFFGNIAHPERCDLFILCLGGDAIELPCMPGLEFDSAVGDCIDIAPGGCTLGDVTTTSVDPTTEDQTTVGLTTEYAETDTPEVSSTTSKPTTTDQNTAEPTTVEPTTKVETTTDSTATSPGRCPDNFFGNIAHLERCDLFILCLGGDAIELPCMPGFEFDSAVGDCIDIAPGGCTLRDVTTTSVDPTTVDQTTVGITTDAESDLREVSTTASPPTTTDQITAEPTTVESTINVKTTTNPTTSSPERCPDNFFGSVAHPERCDLFILCLGGEWIELPCMPGFEFDPVLEECVNIVISGCTLGDETANAKLAAVEPSNTTTSVQTTSDSTTTSPALCPDDLFGLMAHPEQCGLFLLCLGGESIELSCIPEFEFDPVLGQCVEIAEGGCTAGGLSNKSSDTSTQDDQNSPQFRESEQSISEQSKNNAENLEVKCKPGCNEILEHPGLCNAFFICVGDVAHQFYCGNGFEYKAETKECVEISADGCTATKGL